MMSPEERQIETCLIKFNLEEIEKLFKNRLSALPDLEDDNQQQRHKTLAALRQVRSVNADINHLNLENGRLTAKRLTLQQECHNITNMMQKIHEERAQLEELITQEEHKWHLEMNQYEAKLGEITNKFRENAFLYDEEIVRGKTEKANNILSALLKEEKKHQKEIADLNEELNGMKADVPENILDIMGQRDLEEKINFLNAQCEKLRLQINLI